MRKVVAVLTVSVMLAMAASALAAVLPKSGSHFKGQENDTSGHPITFGKFKNPVTFSISGRHVKNFKFGTGLTCAGGFGGPPPSKNPFTTKTARIASMAIAKSGGAYKFSGSTHASVFGGGTASFSVTGKFSSSGKAASGKISFTCPHGGAHASIPYSAKKTKH